MKFLSELASSHRIILYFFESIHPVLIDISALSMSLCLAYMYYFVPTTSYSVFAITHHHPPQSTVRSHIQSTTHNAVISHTINSMILGYDLQSSRLAI